LRGQQSAHAKTYRAEIKRALPAIPKWLKKGNMIRRTYQFKNFPAAVKS